MTAILIGITCVSMNSLIGYSGRHYMDSIGRGISANSDSYKGEQESFSTTNWCITAVVTLLGGVFACFVSSRALKPLHTFASRVENVQPFFRVDKSRSRENGGVGLGLSLVWEIADIHGGKVQAEERTEKGTVMTVTFPLNREYKDD